MSKLFPIVLILVSIGLFFAVIRPYNDKMKAASVDLIQKQDSSEKSDELVTDRQRIEAEYNSITKEDKASLKRVLPDTIDNVRLALDVDQIAQDQGIVIGPITIESDLGAKTRERTVGSQDIANGTIVVNFTFRSDYSSFVAFMQNLETSMRLVDVTGLSVGRLGSSPIYGFDVTLQTYWLR
jgi:hypothetical protein